MSNTSPPSAGMEQPSANLADYGIIKRMGCPSIWCTSWKRPCVSEAQTGPGSLANGHRTLNTEHASGTCKLLIDQMLQQAPVWLLCTWWHCNSSSSMQTWHAFRKDLNGKCYTWTLRSCKRPLTVAPGVAACMMRSAGGCAGRGASACRSQRSWGCSLRTHEADARRHTKVFHA